MKTIQQVREDRTLSVFQKAQEIDQIKAHEALHPAPAAPPVIDSTTIERLRRIKTTLESKHGEAVALDGKAARGQAAMSPLRQQIIDKAAGLDWENLSSAEVDEYVALNAKFDVLRFSLSRAPVKRERLTAEIQTLLRELEALVRSLDRFDGIHTPPYANPNMALLECRVPDALCEIRKLIAEVS